MFYSTFFSVTRYRHRKRSYTTGRVGGIWTHFCNRKSFICERKMWNVWRAWIDPDWLGRHVAFKMSKLWTWALGYSSLSRHWVQKIGFIKSGGLIPLIVCYWLKAKLPWVLERIGVALQLKVNDQTRTIAQFHPLRNRSWGANEGVDELLIEIGKFHCVLPR